MKILENRLLNSLIDGNLTFDEVMNAYNIRTTIKYDLISNVLGFAYLTRRGNYHLILNGNVSHETQCKTFVHEIKHIFCDMPKMGYVVGLDMHRTYFENQADLVAEAVVKYL